MKEVQRVAIALGIVSVLLLTLVSANAYQNRVIQGQRATIQLLMQKPLCPAPEVRPVVPTPHVTVRPRKQQQPLRKPTGIDPKFPYLFNDGNSGRI